ncbi:MAG: TatD family hydrolase [Candidatus Woesearchaeota archaeon]|nr:TatD family hydrolase [Candidatus Woesearchaeota archaeon]
MHLVDVHAHLDHPDFEKDLPDVIKRASARGVVCTIAQGLNHESNLRVLTLCNQHPEVQAALGLYPCEALTVSVEPGYTRETVVSVEETLAFIESKNEEIVAIGEVGLDFKESHDKENQIAVFRQIVQLAKKIHKPLIIHSRKAEQAVLDVLEEEHYTRAIMHCFCGKKKLLQRGVDMGLYFSIPTSVTRNQQFQDNVALLPMQHILTETDAPYMAPMKDLRNEPANIKDAVEKIAELKRMESVEVANQLYFNYQKLFG